MAVEFISVLMWKYSKMNHVIVNKSFVTCLAMCFSLAADSFLCCFDFHSIHEVIRYHSSVVV